MSFAPIEFEVMQELDGIRLQLFIAVRHEEFLDGVCKLSPTEISRKYNKLHNESNTSRIRKKMISEGWFVEVVGGIVTKKFNITAKFAVDESDELQKMQLTAKNAVIGPEQTENGTANFAGTEIANKDLEFKSLNYNSLSPRTREPRKLSVDEAAGILECEQPGPDNPSPTKAIKIFREIYPLYQLDGEQLHDFAKMLPEVEESVWRQNLLDWKLNNYKPGNIAGIISRYHDELKKWVKEKAKNENGGNGNGTIRQSNGQESNHEQRSREASERIQFDRAASDLLESQGIIQTRGS